MRQGCVRFSRERTQVDVRLKGCILTLTKNGVNQVHLTLSAAHAMLKNVLAPADGHDIILNHPKARIFFYEIRIGF